MTRDEVGQLKIGEILRARDGVSIVQPEFFVVNSKYLEFLKLEQHTNPSVSHEIDYVERYVRFSKDRWTWTEPIRRKLSWIAQYYEPVPVKPIEYRNRLSEIENE